ncbi:hypothetical protein CHUAL_008228 [Chamberlinius hualienensis]
MGVLNLLTVFFVVISSIGINAQYKDDGAVIRRPELYLFTDRIEKLISAQVGRELHASIYYLAMASYFGQDNVSMYGFKKFFMDNSNEEKEHAQQLVEYLNSRNGKLAPLNIEMPIFYKGTNGLQALRDALSLEEKVTSHLLDIHKAASDEANHDIHLTDNLESELLREQVESVRKLKGMIAKLSRMEVENNYRVAEYLFDQQLLEKKD